MDLIEFDNAVKVAIMGGMPESITSEIWKKAPDSDYVELCRQRRKNMKGAANGL